MDMVDAAINFRQATISTQVQYAVARKLLDTQSQQGAAVVDMIQKADINQSKAGTDLVAAATGLGEALDVTA